MTQSASSAERIHLRESRKPKTRPSAAGNFEEIGVQAPSKCCGVDMPANHRQPSNCVEGSMRSNNAVCRGIISTLITRLPKLDFLAIQGLTNSTERRNRIILN